jgi:N-formylmaleamate deformylase
MKAGLPWSDAQLEQRMEWLPTCDRTAIIESHKSFHEEDIHRDLPDIAAASLLLYAEKGGTVSDEDADEITGALRNCQKERIDGAGHMIPWDRLEAFVSSVQHFLAD